MASNKNVNPILERGKYSYGYDFATILMIIVSAIAFSEALTHKGDLALQVVALAAVAAVSILLMARIFNLRGRKLERMNKMALAEAREAAESASKSKSDLLASISHEIRTPMNSVLAMAALLKRTNPRADQKEYCDAIDTAGKALLRIIQDVLDLSRAEAGKLSIDLASFEVSRFVEQVAEMIRPSLAPGVVLKLSVESSVPKYLKADAGKVQQVLLNLLGNAAKFTDFGEVSLKVYSVESRIHFDVLDTGVGIPDASINRLFEPFSQVSPESAKEKQGTGLGLAISRRFIEAMGGSIGVSSRAGFGSRFSFDLPLELGSEDEVEIDHSDELSNLEFDGRILVVDDNEANVRVATALLSNMGLSVEAAMGGKEALEKIATQQFDVVLLDCQMPEIDGFEVTRRMRTIETRTGHHLPIVALTAFASKEVSDRCLECGMDDFLTKPIDVESLTAVIGRFLTPSGNGTEVANTVEPVFEKILVSASLVDPDALDRIRRLNPPRGEYQSSNDVVDELIRLFKTSTERTIEILRDHAIHQRPRELAEAAHYFKSSSMSVGATSVTKMMETFESLRGAQSIPEETLGMIDGLAQECAKAISEIETREHILKQARNSQGALRNPSVIN